MEFRGYRLALQDWGQLTRGKIIGLALAAVLTFSIFTGPELQAVPKGANGAVRRERQELIIKYKGKLPGEPDAYKVVGVRAGASIQSTKESLESSSAVDYVEPNYRATMLGVPNDPLFGSQWNFRQIKAPSAWGLTAFPGRNVIVAVLDTGVAYEDRAAGSVTYRRVPDLNTFVPGYDFIDRDGNPNDEQGHGTHVAGVIAQTTNNGYGTAGLAWGAKIMPVRVLDEYGYGTAFDIASAIRWAADHGAKVVNLSLGINGYSRTVEEALAYARDKKKATIVAASGNSALDGGYAGGLMYPASSKYVIAVGATGFNKKRAGYSQYGGGLDLAAPGGTSADLNGDGYIDGILQETIEENNPSAYGYYWLTGTSQAAPHVSAAAAILIARGTKTPTAVYRTLTRSAEDLGPPGFDKYYGHGLLDLFGALTYKDISTQWYFAEGATQGAFNTKILIANPGKDTAEVKAHFSKPGGARVTRGYAIEPGRPLAVQIDKIPGLEAAGVSTKLESVNGVGIVAERNTEFIYRGLRGSHGTIGATSPSRRWYFAEGYTARGFETHILIFNPNVLESKVSATFTRPDGVKVTKVRTIPPRGRRKIIVDDIPGLKAAEFATQVSVVSGPGVVAERSMYFQYGKIDGGHGTIGVVSPETRWLFAEGTTRGSFETWILIQNPAEREARVRVKFSRTDGAVVARAYTIAPGRRQTISVNALPGLANTDVSARVESVNGVGVIAERAMYFNRSGSSGGHVTMGAPEAAYKWYFADGLTADSYETWILVYNPSERTAQVTATFVTLRGATAVKRITVGPRSRRTIAVDAVPGLSQARVATKIAVENGVRIVCEKAVYFAGGGTATMGYP